ncbi:MAG: ROK family protein [Microvirga sp.]|uniref:ROK family transcriptional regulator n=1 Tax=Microvirga tunisiensis TaxID=2108360 RepID=A0A5N7MMF4_9HYPH|nr:ROK family transcriptional regulator [Microvirga tunisiensis]MPR09995.1 ROK family transcriptional regulator [Microvirga tunisiensis]MPR28187.1 ROK family transcriptional regulator [Microvirga tunisiensis]
MKTADPELMRAINRFVVMDAIRRSGTISRVEISERTELSPTTVSAITAALLEDGLIIPRQVAPAPDQVRGRPRIMLELNPAAASVCGAKLAPNKITISVTNFQADVLGTVSIPIRVDRQPASVILDLVEDGVRSCIEAAGLQVEDINSLCLGVPGIVERASGICRYSPIFSERDLKLGLDLQGRLKVPTTVESDVNLITLAEQWFGHGRDLSDFLVVSIEHTIGLGIIHGGELFRGANGLSPDLGDLIVSPNGSIGNGSRPGRLSGIASTTAILSVAADLARGTPQEKLLRGTRGIEHAVSLAQAGNGGISRIFEEAGRALGIAIANLITLFAPPKVILAGAALQAGDLLLKPLRDAVQAATPETISGVTEIVVHESSDDTWARGAAALTLRDLYGASWGTTGPAKKR